MRSCRRAEGTSTDRKRNPPGCTVATVVHAKPGRGGAWTTLRGGFTRILYAPAARPRLTAILRDFSNAIGETRFHASESPTGRVSELDFSAGAGGHRFAMGETIPHVGPITLKAAVGGRQGDGDPLRSPTRSSWADDAADASFGSAGGAVERGRLLTTVRLRPLLVPAVLRGATFFWRAGAVPGSGRRLSGSVCSRSRMNALTIFNAARASRSVRRPLKYAASSRLARRTSCSRNS